MSAGGHRLIRAVTRSVVDDAGRKFIVKHFATQPETMQNFYSEMVEDVCEYRDILIEHRIGEYQSSQKEKVARTAGLVGLQVPKLYEHKD